MGTRNFIEQKILNIPIRMFVRTYQRVYKDYENYEEQTGELLPFDETIILDWERDDIEYMLMDYHNLWETNRNLRKPSYFDIELSNGYYGDFVLTIRAKENYVENNIEFIEDVAEYYGLYPPTKKRVLEIELNRINKYLLSFLAKKLGFVEIRTVGVFSNGEGVYEEIK